MKILFRLDNLDFIGKRLQLLPLPVNIVINSLQHYYKCLNGKTNS